MEILEKMQGSFRQCFGRQGSEAFFSPGRVNLIGEHTDYNGGHVFPCAISLGTYALTAPRTDRRLHLCSLNRPSQAVEIDLSRELVYDEGQGWANYPLGVVRMLQERGCNFTHGFDILFYGNLPSGAGLSSSASLEVLMAVVCNDLLHFGLERVELVQLSQAAENKFVGVQCGIMDQFAVGMGKKDCAILLDCNTLAYRYSKIEIGDCCIVITNTNKKHSLGDSKYNERRRQCETALAQIQTVRPVASLGELTAADFETVAGVITDPVNRRRARHAVLENQRTLAAVEALENKDIKRFGELMNASHVSLRDDYEVTGDELDTLAALAWGQEGVIGSRMTGAGFGGCTVSIVRREAIADFERNLTQKYTEKFGYAPTFYEADIADGAGRLAGE